MEYILSGNEADVAKVLQENSVRVRRGVIKFTPVGDGEDSKEPDAADTKEVTVEDSKKPKRPKKN